MQAVDGIAPYRELRLKDTLKTGLMVRSWRELKIVINFKKNTKNQNWKLTTKSIDPKFIASSLIKSNKINYFKQKIVENTGNSRKLWKTLNTLGIPSKKWQYFVRPWD